MMVKGRMLLLLLLIMMIMGLFVTLVMWTGMLDIELYGDDSSRVGNLDDVMEGRYDGPVTTRSTSANNVGG
jgi:hypothetical protein